MKKQLVLAIGCMTLSSGVMAAAEDDPLLFKLMIDKIEWRAADEANLWVWDADAWVGKDLNKLWFKTEGEHVDGTVEGAFAEVLYSRAVSAYVHSVMDILRISGARVSISSSAVCFSDVRSCAKIGAIEAVASAAIRMSRLMMRANWMGEGRRDSG